MFIGWINQMLAVLDKREGKAVQAILWEIAQTYPQVSITCTPFHLKTNEGALTVLCYIVKHAGSG